MDDLFSSFENIDPFKVKLNKIGLKKNDKFTYLYDFGDDWYHTIKVMSTDYSPLLPDQDFGRYGGRRACPPEDCGGPWGYVRLLEILADPRHEEYEEMREWTGDDFDPEAFSLWLK